MARSVRFMFLFLFVKLRRHKNLLMNHEKKSKKVKQYFFNKKEGGCNQVRKMKVRLFGHSPNTLSASVRKSPIVRGFDHTKERRIDGFAI